MRSKKQTPNKDENSLTYIWVTIFVSISVAIFISIQFSCPISNYIYFKDIGLALILMGVIFRFWIIYSLGKFFTVDINIAENHTLKKNGFYTLVRHPSYSFSLLSFVGLGLSLNNWFSFFSIIIPIFISFLYRIKIEEKVLLKEFGEEYFKFSQNTKALIPFVY